MDEDGTREVLIERSNDTRGYQIRVQKSAHSSGYDIAYRVYAIPTGRRRIEIHKFVAPGMSRKDFFGRVLPRYQKVDDAGTVREAYKKLVELVRARAKNYLGVDGFRVVDRTGDGILNDLEERDKV
jgi:hypothetical protein